MADITEEEQEELWKELDRKFGEQSQSLFQFLNNVVRAKDTTRIGNVSEDELGLTALPIRTHEELALLASDDPEWNNYFNAMSEIITSTSLSKGGFLVRQATIQRKEFADKSKKKSENKGLFKKKEEEKEE